MIGERVQITKTLWMLDYRRGAWNNLVPIYAEDEHGDYPSTISLLPADAHTALLTTATLLEYLGQLR